MTDTLKALKQEEGTTSVTVPSTHPDAGKKITVPFTYPVVETDEQAHDVLAEKEWSLIELVNDQLKANAKSSAYQSALNVYKPSEVDPAKVRQGMINGFIRSGLSVEMATQVVDAALAMKSA